MTITLHGKKNVNPLPGLGNKFIGSINGTIDIHGKKRIKTWTVLSETASIGDTTIKLKESVDWV